MFTGLLSRESHPWLADHAVFGAVLLSGATFLELALHAGGEMGCPVVRELVLEAPLVLADGARVRVQVSVGEAGEGGARSVEVHSHTGEDDGEDGWVRHASGSLAPGGIDGSGAGGALDERAAELGGVWPPAGAVAVSIDDLYERLGDVGLEYGPAFQRLRSVWQRGDEVFAEVELSDEQAAQAASYGVHPTLLDSALQASEWMSLVVESGIHGERGVRLPCSVSGVRLDALGASRLRVGLALTGEEELSLVAVDDRGGLVVSASSLRMREATAEQLDGVDRGLESLFCVEWVPVAADGGAVDVGAEGVLVDVESLTGVLERGEELPGVVVLDMRRAVRA